MSSLKKTQICDVAGEQLRDHSEYDLRLLGL